VRGVPEDCWRYDEERQTLFVETHNDHAGQRHAIVVELEPPPPPPPLFKVNHLRGDFATLFISVLSALIAVIYYV
jgi:hypothetical protein